MSPRAAGKPEPSVLTCAGKGAGEAVAPGLLWVALLTAYAQLGGGVCDCRAFPTWKRTELSGLGALS